MNLAEIKKLPLRERFQILDLAPWEDLSDKIEDIELTQADRDLIDAPLSSIKSGETEILNWDVVKHTIGQA